MADVLVDSDVLIWHLRGRADIVEQVQDLSSRYRLGISVITRAEILAGLRDKERKTVLDFLESCEAVPVDVAIADRAGEIVRTFRRKGTTLHLPDALIGASALERGIPLFTCNARHYPMDGLDLRVVELSST